MEYALVMVGFSPFVLLFVSVVCVTSCSPYLKMALNLVLDLQNPTGS
jgi:hypothetical protein